MVHFIFIMKKNRNKNPVQPISGTKVPRFAGPSTFARLPELRDVESCDVAIVGIPFDAGTSYRPGAKAGSRTSISIDKYKGLLPTLFLILSAILSVPCV